MLPTTTPPNEPIAIVGSACHFAGSVNSPSELWELLRNPRDIRSEIPESRFNAQAFYHKNHAHHGHSNVMYSYLIEDDIRRFDAEFFGINPVEAAAMDPQQRMFVETVYEAIEAAGMTIEGLRKSDTGVFVGAMCADYEAMQFRDLDAIPTYLATGTARSILSNRVSYLFDWHGPCMTVDTACSSSLVAVHLAVKALRSGETKMALAGGSNLILGPESYIMESKLKMLSPDGLGRMWDRKANGYARGDGVAAIVLKKLSSAILDGDHIECILRETGVNQDGATPGITMPSATAQQALIERTYANAGLDLRLVSDQPQLFEAHGTGTPAGDPIEAEAISKAFFGQDNPIHSPTDHLLVGSFKTILGHTEGTAGIAAILKASLEIQHGQITPNLHFDDINPAIVPFYGNLQIPKIAQAWPESLGAPRRASVNCFGFGGTNAHAILESWNCGVSPNSATTPPRPLFTPFLFSAASEASLRANLLATATHLADHPPFDTHRLAYTMRQRRSVFSHRIAYAAASLEDLSAKILSSLGDKNIPIGVTAKRSGEGGLSRILGIFTGQGAQYSRMGATLIEESSLASTIIGDLELHLSELPDADRPTWSLRSELVASASLVHEAAISQPLCTAVQILIVDILRLAQVEFDIVIGHSSGEIAAAYAAGYLTARDAIVIAYYRGFCCKYAASPNDNVKGAMLAVGTSIEDATKLCEDELFAGRINVAASNSPTSITISGDEDAIVELETVLGDEGKFNRRLRVDYAYHSLHMLPCTAPYIESLLRANVKFQTPPESNRPLWYTTVYEESLVNPDAIPSVEYWSENMTKPVLFNQALAAALADHPDLGVVLEVGPHPALRSPASQSIHDILTRNVPYHGCLDRKMDAIQSMSGCLAFLWSHMEERSVDISAYEMAVAGTGESLFTPVKGLPPYRWDHGVTYWHESRRSTRTRLRQGVFHPLLGDESPESASHSLHWKNVLKPSEIAWLEGHRVEGQIVFPAAGYVCTAIEAGKVLGCKREVLLIELRDFLIHQAITFGGDDSAIEVLIELSQVAEHGTGSLRAKFTYSAALGAQADELTLVASAEVRLVLGSTSPEVLPERPKETPHLIDVEPQRLYGFMERLGYNFTGAFRSLKKLRRKLGRAVCELSVQNLDTGDDFPLLLHPVEVDAAFQSIMLAYSYPGDDQLRALHLPASIRKIRVNPTLCASRRVRDTGQGISVDSSCHRADRTTPGSGFSGHANLYISGCSHAALQVDAVLFVPFSGTTMKDRNVFFEMEWVPVAPDGASAADGIPISQNDHDLLWVLSRIASFYLRKFDHEVPANSPLRTTQPLCHYLRYAHHMTELLKRGEHRYARKEWIEDTFDDVTQDVKRHGFSSSADVKIMFLVGETMPRVFKQETTMIEHMRTSGLLDQYYIHGFGTMQSSLWLGRTVKQIASRHPHLNILEVGAGTGGATKSILRSIGHSFGSYTFTDISSSFFENAAGTFAPWIDRMVFKVYDAERDPVDQGFDDRTCKYDVVVASLVIHATTELANTMRNLRKLLKPGGYLVVAEGTSDGPLQSGDGFIFGSLPGWWLGVEEGRVLSPFVNVDQWDTLLKSTGFSGIDELAPPAFLETFGLVLFVSQAIDDRITFLRKPLATTAVPTLSSPIISKLILVGGTTEPVSVLTHQLESFLKGIAGQIFIYGDLEEMDYSIVDETSAVISLVELDAPSFKQMTPERWLGFRKLFESGKTLMWVSTGRLSHEPWSNMPVGFGRSAVNEVPGLNVQFIDFPTLASIKAVLVAENLLRLHAKGFEGDDVLWTTEPELIIDEEGRHLAPRLIPIPAANERYNSIHRPIFHEVDIGESPVELHQTLDKCNVRVISRRDGAKGTGSVTTKLQTSHTVLSALKTDYGPWFLSSGSDPLGNRYLSLISRPTSVLDIPQGCAVPYDIGIPGLTEIEFLTTVAAHLISLVIMKPLLPGHTVMLHNAPPVIAKATETQAALKGIQVFCTTDSGDHTLLPSSWVRLPPYIDRTELEHILPANLASFVGFSSKDCSENEDCILAALPRHCYREQASSLYSIDSIDTSVTSTEALTSSLEEAVRFAQNASISRPEAGGEVIGLADLIAGERPKNPITVVDWDSPRPLATQVVRLDGRPMFKGDRTYWICGMSGALGISLCDWMIDRGVKHLVITTRNPKIHPSWVEDHKRRGVAVNIIPCDVTDEPALRAVYETIIQDMPPIAGALNGAMVLRDSSISNMQYDQVTDVIGPKVLGSLNLDQIFHDINLDFFILVSSINCIVGNVGQANYAAANMFMCGLAAQRRKRGLNAVAVNGGAIIGAGYITRETDRALDITVEKMAMMHLSEEDFHQIIAEAIEAGHVGSPTGPEISTGLLDISPDSPNIPKWYSNPKFSRFVVHQTASHEDKREKATTASIQDQLQNCKTQHDLSILVTERLGDQLRKILQMPADTPKSEMLSKRGPELGLDSLISVDIQSWFLKNFQVTVPVLKIMSNHTMTSLVQSAIEDIPVEMTPQLQKQYDGGSIPLASIRESSSRANLEPIDWEAESALPPETANIPRASGSPPAVPPKVVVITGATGHLGGHLLSRLLRIKSIETIHCLAVRKLTSRLQSKELPAEPRVKYHEGDLADPLLGLSEQQASSIFAEADAVIHNGADTSHAKFYTELRESNVGSTTSLVLLCLPRQIPIHYISSAGVAIYYNQETFPPRSLAEPGSLYPAWDGSFGYGCSKWVSERLLENVHRQHDNFPICIYRPSTILRDGDDSTTVRAQLDWVNSLLRSIRKIRAAPQTEHNHGALDLVRVESCCHGVIDRVVAGPKKGVEYVNQVGDIVIPLDTLHNLDADEGEVYALLPLRDWIREATTAGLHPGVAFLIQEMDKPGRPDYPMLVKD